MAFVREHRRGNRTYYELVESYRDENGQPRQRKIRWIGDDPNAETAESLGITGLDLGPIAVKMLAGELTPTDLLKTLETIGQPTTLKHLESMGIHYDFKKKKLELYLFPPDWTMAPKRSARSAKKKSPRKKQSRGKK